ncbi:MAG: lysylphosphatidylglycerol synthase domain-containing protein [Janthinobacterium lividum]
MRLRLKLRQRLAFGIHYLRKAFQRPGLWRVRAEPGLASFSRAALPALLALAGLALAWHLIADTGATAVLHAAASLGWPGFALVLAAQLLLVVPMGVAWWLLGRGRPDARLPRFVWARLVRDSAGEALPFSQLGGYAAGARALAVAGVSGPFAAASTVVDVSTELAGQLGYTLLGLALLAWRRPGSGLLAPVLLATLAMAALVAAFAAVQVRGAGAVDRLLVRASARLPTDEGRAGAPAAALADAVRTIHARRGALLAAIGLHFAEWVLSGVQAWATLRLMGLRPGLSGALVIDSLLYGARSFAFLVPNAIGVQEATLVVVGALFGVPPDAALGLSLVRRARDLALAVPALCTWQVLEARRAKARSRLRLEHRQRLRPWNASPE